MKRVGERGSGKFARISWEEAARIIAEKDAGGRGKSTAPEARYFLYATGNCGVMRPEKMLKRLVNLDGGFLNAYNSYSSACSTYVSPYIYGDASGGNSEADVLNSKLIILWGHNPSETIFGSLHNYYLAQAKAKGHSHRGHRPAHERYGAEPFRGVDPAPADDGRRTVRRDRVHHYQDGAARSCVSAQVLCRLR